MIHLRIMHCLPKEKLLQVLFTAALSWCTQEVFGTTVALIHSNTFFINKCFTCKS